MAEHSGDFSFNRVADVLGLGRLSDGDPGMDPQLLRDLYAHARNEDSKRVLFDNDPTFKKGWVNLNSPRAQELISAFVPLDDVDNLKKARFIAKANLEAQAWNDVLDIDSPPITCKVKVHGAKWGLRFQSAEPTLKGKERVNEALPPCMVKPVEAAGTVNTECQADNVCHPVSRDHCSADLSAAEEALRKGGLPA